MLKHIHFFIGLLLCYTFAVAQAPQTSNYFDQHYRLQGRIGKGLVFDILQDRYGWIWLATEYGLIQYGGQVERSYRADPEDPYSLSNNVVTCLAEDALGNLWVGTMNKGLHYFDRRTERFYRYQYDKEDENSLAGNKINKIVVDRVGSVWVTVEGGGVHRYDKEKDHFQRFQKPAIRSPYADALLEDKNRQLWLGAYFGISKWSEEQGIFLAQADVPPAAQQVKVLVQDSSGRIWAGCRNGGLTYLDTLTNQLKPIKTLPAWPDKADQQHIWDLHAELSGQLWVATDEKLFHLMPDSRGTIWRRSTFALSKERRYLCIYRSSDGVMWIGTNNGALVLAPRLQKFDYFEPQRAGEPASVRRGITTIAEADSGQLWVGTTRGLFQFDLQKRYFHQDFLSYYPSLEPFAEANIASLYQDERRHLWLAVIQGFNAGFGLFRSDLERRQTMDFSPRHTLLYSFATLDISADAKGNLWFSNQNGLLHYTPPTDRLSSYQHDGTVKGSLGSNRINQVQPTGTGQLLVATNDAGLDQYEYASNSFHPFLSDVSSDTIPQLPRILTIFIDRRQQLWLGTDGGLLHLRNDKTRIKYYGRRHGLADPIIKSIQQDKQGRMWIASQTAISRFDPVGEVFTNFDTLNGLRVEEFWNRVSYSTPDGYLYFGGNLGMTGFHPDSIRFNTHLPTVVFTDLLLFNQSVTPDSASRLLPAPLHLDPLITLRYDQHVFSIHFAGLSYINPEKVQYAVWMEGFEENWQMVGTRTEATYTNLDPGTYFFHVKAANSDGLWNDVGNTLQLIVLPPWYRTWWAYLTGMLILMSVLYWLYHFQLNRRLAEAEAVRLRELDTVKTQLYTNITHEIRTPLTLIQGPVEQALRRPGFSLGKAELERIRQNCRRLLHLIQQMLHLSKLEAGALRSHYLHGDITDLIKYIVDAFSSFADSRHIDLQLQIVDADLSMDHDQAKLLDVISNLVSNALKFTLPGGKVNVIVAKVAKENAPWLSVKVQDTGIGLAISELDRIFDRFYQVPNTHTAGGEETARSGSGIGLALTRKLVELMDGQITVSSTPGQGSIFEILLPVRHTMRDKSSKSSDYQDFYVPKIMHSLTTEKVNRADIQQAGPTILIVEDNTEVARFVANSLPEAYRIHIATDGQAGWQWAVEHIPDLIISDILMPRMDGYQLTQRLKADQRTSHIPIILLTAKVDMDSKLLGLEKGADDYLAKPFHSQELMIRIENLLSLRRRLQEYYRRQNGIESNATDEVHASAEEHAFLQQVRRHIMARMEQGDYKIESLAQDLHMSPSQLYRKMMALIGQSPSKFYRHIQINQSKELLINSDLSITDIAYRTGFNDPAYFTRVFTASTGEAPTRFRQQHGG